MLDQVQTKAAMPSMDDACGQVLREDALSLSNKNLDSAHNMLEAKSLDASNLTASDPRVASFKGAMGESSAVTNDLLPRLELKQNNDATPRLADEPPVNYDDTTGIDRRRFYIAQPNNYSCAPTSLTEALFDFNSSGGDSGLHFDGATFANPSSREAVRKAVERAEEEPQKDFGSIDEEAMYAAKFGLATKLHFNPDSGVTITPANVNEAMAELDVALAAGHGVIINVPHHFVYCAGKTADGQYIMGDPAESRTTTWNTWRMTNEMDHMYDPFNNNRQ